MTCMNVMDKHPIFQPLYYICPQKKLMQFHDQSILIRSLFDFGDQKTASVQQEKLFFHEITQDYQRPKRHDSPRRT